MAKWKPFEDSPSFHLKHEQLAGLVAGLLMSLEKTPDAHFRAGDIAEAIRHIIEIAGKRRKQSL